MAMASRFGGLVNWIAKHCFTFYRNTAAAEVLPQVPFAPKIRFCKNKVLTQFSVALGDFGHGMASRFGGG